MLKFVRAYVTVNQSMQKPSDYPLSLLFQTAEEVERYGNAPPTRDGVSVRDMNHAYSFANGFNHAAAYAQNLEPLPIVIDPRLILQA